MRLLLAIVAVWLSFAATSFAALTAEQEAALIALLDRTDQGVLIPGDEIRTRFIDATDPPDGLNACNPDDQNDDTTNLRAIIDYVTAGNQQAVLYLPPAKVSGQGGGYRISSTIEIGDIDGLKIIGAGQSRSDTTGTNIDGFTRIKWVGGNTGPAILLSDVDGLVVDGISFESDTTPADTEDQGGGLDILVKHVNGAGGSGSLNLRFRDCGFHNAEKLFHNGSSASSLGSANILFDNCCFDGHHTGASAAQYGFYCQNNQGLIYTFLNCYYLNLGTVFHFEEGGRLQVYGGGMSQCYKLIHKEAGSQNTSGFAVRDLFIDGNGTERMIWLSTSKTLDGRSYGPFVFEGITMPSNYPADGATFAPVSSWNGTTLIIAGKIDMRPGDRINFYDENDHAVVLATTDVVANQGVGVNSTYTVSHTCCDVVGLPADMSTVDAAAGNGLFELHGGETVIVRDCFFKDDVILGERLARLQTGSFDTGRVPFITFERCQGFDNLSAAGDLVTKYLKIASSPSYYRFQDCHERRGAIDILSTTNVP